MKNNAIKSADKLLGELKQAREIIEEARKSTKNEFLRDNLILGVETNTNNFLSNNSKLAEIELPEIKRIK